MYPKSRKREMESTSSIEIANTTTNEITVPFVFDSSYKGDELSQKVASALTLPDRRGWSVVDSKDALALVHYEDDADMTKLGHLRGVVVDTEVNAIIAESFGYTPTAVSSELTIVDGSIRIADKDGEVHTFDPATSVIKRVFEGVVIRVLWHKGNMLRITHRRINSERSRWGSAKTFLSMYEEAGGPKAEQLFDTTKPYSSTVYDFLVVAPELLVGTRQKVATPYLVLLAIREMDLKRPVDQVAKGKNEFVVTNNISGSVDQSIIHDPKHLSLDDANHHLKFGYYNPFNVTDERQLTGEAIIIYSTVDGAVRDIVKVHSPSYEWRVNMRGNNPNIRNQFYSLLNSVYPDVASDDAWTALSSRFILLTLYDEASIKARYEQSGAILTIPPGTVSRDMFVSRDARIHLLWLNLLLSLPANMQKTALDLLTQFKTERDQVITWLQNVEQKFSNIEKLEISNRAKGIVSCSRRLARERIATGKNYSANGSYMKIPVLIKNTIRNLINKESGTSLYSLVRELKQIEQDTKESQEQ
jgi:hypothetical protein